MGRDALPPRDPSKMVFEPSQQRGSFVIDPVASSAAGSSGEPEIAESTGTSCRRRFVPTVAVGILRRSRCQRTASVAPISRHHGSGWRPPQSVGTTSRRC